MIVGDVASGQVAQVAALREAECLKRMVPSSAELAGVEFCAVAGESARTAGSGSSSRAMGSARVGQTPISQAPQTRTRNSKTNDSLLNRSNKSESYSARIER